MFQHTAARRRLQYKNYGDNLASLFQHTAARRRLPESELLAIQQQAVSTHSRPKAAAIILGRCGSIVHSFNTQPPKGGCSTTKSAEIKNDCFNTQPPEGGCFHKLKRLTGITMFQHTAARRRLLPRVQRPNPKKNVSTHSRPKAAAFQWCLFRRL